MSQKHNTLDLDSKQTGIQSNPPYDGHATRLKYNFPYRSVLRTSHLEPESLNQDSAESSLLDAFNYYPDTRWGINE